MKKIVKLTERDLTRLVKRVIKEDKDTKNDYMFQMDDIMGGFSEDILEVIEDYKIKIEEIMFEANGDRMLEDYELKKIEEEYEDYIYYITDIEKSIKGLM